MKTSRLFVVLSLLCAVSTLRVSAAPTITATQDDATLATTRKLVGDTVTYTTTISNTAAVIVGSNGNDATGVQLTNPTPTNTTEVVGVSISPVAFDDVYPQTILPNIGINSGNIPYSVFTNDFTGTPAVTTIASFSQATHGTVTMVTSGANIGQFTYEPAAGYSGADSFTYTLTNSVGSSVGTVNLTVSASPVIWFVNPAVGVTGTGTLSSPFKTVAEAVTAIGNNTSHRIFLYSGSQTTGIALKTGGWLVGQGATTSGGATFDSTMGITPGTGAIARPTIGGTRPALSNSTGSVVTLADNNLILGVAISGGATGAAVNGPSGVNNLTIGSDCTIGGAGGGAFSLVGGAGTVNVAAPITSATGRSVNVANRGTGVVTFFAAVSDTGAGVFLDNNDQAGQATITFSAGLSLSTGANAAFTATNGGIVNATQNNTSIVNTLTTTTGTALNVANTTIGANGLTFRSINSNGAGSDGIILNNTGLTAGLTVTGNGGTCTNADQTGCSGGQISGKTGSDDSGTTPIGTGIVLNNTINASFTRMWVHDHSNYAIRGNSVTGFTFANSVVNGANGTEAPASAGSPFNESAIRFTGLFGSASITNSYVSGGVTDNIGVINTSGSLNRLTIDSCTFGNNSPTQGNRNLDFNSTVTGTINVTVSNCTFTASASHFFGFDASGTGGDVIFTNNTISQGRPGIGGVPSATGGGGVKLTGTSSTVTFLVQGNHITGVDGNAMLFVHDGSGSFTGTVTGNFIGNAAVANSGSIEGDGIQLLMPSGLAGNTVSVAITNNDIRQYNNFGIELASGSSGLAGETGNISATVTGNTIGNPGNNASISSIFQGVQLNTATVDGQTWVWCLNLKNNSIVGSGRNGGTDFRLRQRFDTKVMLPGYGGTPYDTAAVTAFIQSQNSPTPTGAALTDQPSGGFGFVNTPGGGACASGLLVAEAGVQPSQCFASTAAQGSMIPSESEQVSATSLAPTTNVAASRAAVPTALTQAEVDRVARVAREQWKASGLSAQQLSRLNELHFEVADLPGHYLGEADGSRIRVDNDAGGNGWSRDGDLSPDRVDLLTTIMHEMGHALGLTDSYDQKDRDSVMYGFLPIGERRFPAKDQATGIVVNEKSGPHFLSGAVNIGTLPPGKSVKIVYSVTVGPITTVNPQSVSSQGTVSGSNFTSVLTSDAVAGSGATITLLAIPPAITSANATTFTVGSAGSFNVTSTGAPAATYSFTGSLPSGVTLSAAGLLSGTPAAATGGSYPIVITANNGIAPNATQNFTLTVNQPPAITSANATTFVVGSAGTFTVTTSGFPVPTVTQTGTLPSGVMFDSATKILSGTPGAGTGGTYSISFKAANGIGSDATQTFTLTVNQAPAITSAASTTFTVGTAGTFTVTATGFPSPTFSETGALPAGVTLGAVSGVLAGTPGPDTQGTYNITMMASNGVGSAASQPFTLTINAIPCTAAVSGMISWLPANNNTNDLIGSNNAVLQSGATYGTGEVGQAFNLVNAPNATSGQYVNVATPVGLPVGNAARTVEMWFITATTLTTSPNAALIQYGTATTEKSFGLVFTATNPGKLYFNGSGDDLAGTTTVLPGQWYHAAVTYDGAAVRLYLNGQLEGTKPTPSLNTALDANGLTIGLRPATSVFNGKIDEVQIFNRALTQAEIQATYYAGAQGTCAPPLALSSAVSRRIHGASPFDVNLPIAGTSGIEPRSSTPAGNHTVVFT
ncbi:MAG: LamG-like jellyroll fold domain-containing protein, partial [Chthoniobacterales bacterium]